MSFESPFLYISLPSFFCLDCLLFLSCHFSPDFFPENCETFFVNSWLKGVHNVILKFSFFLSLSLCVTEKLLFTLQALVEMAPKYILEQFIETELLVNITEHMVKTFFCAVTQTFSVIYVSILFIFCFMVVRQPSLCVICVSHQKDCIHLCTGVLN